MVWAEDNDELMVMMEKSRMYIYRGLQVCILLYMCPHTIIYVSSYCNICALILLYTCVSSYCCTRERIYIYRGLQVLHSP